MQNAAAGPEMLPAQIKTGARHECIATPCADGPRFGHQGATYFSRQRTSRGNPLFKNMDSWVGIMQNAAAGPEMLPAQRKTGARHECIATPCADGPRFGHQGATYFLRHRTSRRNPLFQNMDSRLGITRKAAAGPEMLPTQIKTGARIGCFWGRSLCAVAS